MALTRNATAGDGLIPPHGGALVHPIAGGEQAEELRRRARQLPPVPLTPWARSDVQLLGEGAYSPLSGFLGSEDVASVVHDMRLTDGTLWPIPITLRVGPDVARRVREGGQVALWDAKGTLAGVMTVQEVFSPDKSAEALGVYGTEELDHPGVRRLMSDGAMALAGPVTALARQGAGPFGALQLSPARVRAAFAARGWRSVVGFQTRNPVHRAHEYIQKCALELVDGLFLHPLVGETKADDLPADLRLKSYETLIEHYYPKERVLLAAFAAAMRYAGPREAVLHALVRKNYGCSHFIVGRDHAGVGNYYGTYEAQDLIRSLDPADLGVTPLCFEHSFFCRACDAMATRKTCPHGDEDHVTLSGTRVRALLRDGKAPPPTFCRPEVARVLIQGMGAPLKASRG